ncbi:hypothetical protein AVEN_47160-1, partial [Araneus ventricosus]
LALKQHEGYFGTDLVSLIRGQMTRTAPGLESLSLGFRATPAGGRLAPYIWLNLQRARWTMGHRWNRVSVLERSSPKAETLPLGYRGLN